MTPRIADALRAQAATLAALAEALDDASPAAGAPRYADASHNPLDSARAFLDAARAGQFPTFRRGRRVTALWSDVERWIESRRREPRPTRPEPVDAERAELERAGVRLGRRGSR